MAKAKEENAVATVEEKSNLPAELMEELLRDADEFEETMTRDDMAVPFIQILQQLSPQVVEGDSAFLEGAKAGMFFNTVSNELYSGKEGITLIPIHYKASYIEWVPRNQGGGFVAEYDVAEGSSIRTARNENGQDIIQQGSPLGTPGNQLAYTHTHYVVVVKEDGTFELAVITMTSTQVKFSKKWNLLINQTMLPGTMKRAPRFFGVWKATTTLNSNDQGKWYTWTFARAGTVFDLPNGAALYQAAREFARSVLAGEKKVDYDKVAPEANPSTDGGDAPKDEEIPF